MDMKLIGTRITKILAERAPEYSGQLKLETNINIKSIDFNTSKGKDSIKVNALYSIDYDKLGKIEIEGLLFFNGSEKDLKKMISIFDKKDYNTPEMIEIMNIVLQKFSLKAFEVQEDLGLPIHIKLPTLQTKKD